MPWSSNHLFTFSIVVFRIPFLIEQYPQVSVICRKLRNKTHVEFAALPQRRSSLSSTHVNAPVPFGTSTKIGGYSLRMTKKKTCDVCKHPYSFTKVYATDMPTRLPPVLLLRRVAQQSFFAMLFAVRAVAVAIIWLAVLPWVTVMTWRMYFSMGDSTAWWISDRPRPPDAPEQLSPFYLAFYSEPTAVPPPDTFIARVATNPLWISLSSDIFTGQIIASLVVLTFVAVFLLREWISQNARPGVFEDEDPEPVPVPLPLPPPPPQQQQLLELPRAPPPHPNPNVNDRIALAQRQMDAVRAMDAMRTFDPAPERPNRKRRLSHKGKEPEEAGGIATSSAVASGSRRRTRKEESENDGQTLHHRRLQQARLSRNLHRQGISVPDSSALDNSDNFEFTFRSATHFPPGSGRRSVSAVSCLVSLPVRSRNEYIPLSTLPIT
ncbi:hypothetical protein DFH06DRAFT_1393557 [Mycena polygramma]|nr:hypothetical protein DFH06DRAFT_1393557 [Mycena polygramma]